MHVGAMTGVSSVPFDDDHISITAGDGQRFVPAGTLFLGPVRYVRVRFRGEVLVTARKRYIDVSSAVYNPADDIEADCVN